VAVTSGGPVVAGRRSGRLALHCMAQWLLEGGGPVHSHSDTARPPKVVAQHVGEGALG